MSTEAWPVDVLKPRTISRRIKARTLRGTVAISGFTQRVSVPAHAWVIEYGGMTITNAVQRRAWDALEAALDGGANAILVPVVGETEVQPIPTQAFSDDTLFTDGTGHSNGVAWSAEMVGAASAGATVITIRHQGTDILAGQHFSIGERLYRVAKVLSVVNGDEYQVSIRPPLREAVLDEAEVDFVNLVCKCRLASDDQMNLTLEPPGFGITSVAFVEDPN